MHRMVHMFEFEFENFVPEPWLEQFAQQMLRQLVEAVPYDSFCTAAVRKDGERYTVKVRMRAFGGRFEAVSRKLNLLEAIENAEMQIARQIEQWHLHRELSRATLHAREAA